MWTGRRMLADTAKVRSFQTSPFHLAEQSVSVRSSPMLFHRIHLPPGLCSIREDSISAPHRRTVRALQTQKLAPHCLLVHFCSSPFLFCNHVRRSFPKVELSEELRYTTMYTGSWFIGLPLYDLLRTILNMAALICWLVCIPHLDKWIPMSSKRQYSRRAKKGRQQSERWGGA